MEAKALFTLLLSLLILDGCLAVTFNYLNQCDDSVWLAASPGIGDAMPEYGSGTLTIFDTPDTWSGMIWARTKCTTNTSNYFSCETGDCGTGEPDCQGPPPTFPVTLLQFNIAIASVSYEVSLNHGYNDVPVRIQPDGGTLEGGSMPCPVVDCVQDLSNVCPSTLVAKNSAGVAVGCFSPCDALKDPKYCCTGSFTGPQCQPNEFSQTFKNLCNLAHTYPGDNVPPIYKCKGANAYNITFCPF